MAKTSNIKLAYKGAWLDVDFCYYPACRGSRDRWGAPLEPDEPEDIEVEVVRAGGEDITALLSDDMIEAIGAVILTEGRE